MPASTYSGNAYLDCFLRGVAPTVPTGVYVSLHTADPGVTGANEVSTADWPAYVRRDAAAGGAVGTAFSAAASKVALNQNQMLYPAHDGASPIIISHFAIWDAATVGNCLYSGALVVDPLDPASAAAPKTINPTDELVIYPEEIGVQVD